MKDAKGNEGMTELSERGFTMKMFILFWRLFSKADCSAISAASEYENGRSALLPPRCAAIPSLCLFPYKPISARCHKLRKSISKGAEKRNKGGKEGMQ